MERREINIAHGERTERERERAVIRPGSGDVIVNYHPLIHLQHTPTHTQTQTHTVDLRWRAQSHIHHHTVATQDKREQKPVQIYRSFDRQ